MKRVIYKSVLGVVGVIFMFLLSLCGESLAKDHILMGVSAPISGPDGRVGEMIVTGYKIWGDMVNKEGGIYVKDLNKKLPVKLIILDDRSDPATAARVYERLITVDKVDITLSPWGSSIGFPVSGICQKYKMPFVCIMFASNPIFKQGYDYTFGTIEMASRHEWSPIDLLAKQKDHTNKIMFIATKGLYQITTAKGGHQHAMELGLNPYYEEVEKGVKDFTPLITKMKSLGIGAISTGLFEPEFFLLVRQMLELRYYPEMVYASHGTDLPEFLGYLWGSDKRCTCRGVLPSEMEDLSE